MNDKHANAMSEVLWYLNGIKKVDVDKIPKKLIDFFKSKASDDYECQFDYSKPISELKLQEETRGLIAMITLNYWCETKEEKNLFVKKLNENETNYQEKLSKKYDIENIFKTRK